jgi:hypothetical protein
MDRILEILRVGAPVGADRTLTDGGIIMIVLIFVGTILFAGFFSSREPNWYKHYFILAIAVLIFEVFTSPMWVNNHFGSYGYIYQDVSWILTLGWTTLMLSVVYLVDMMWGHLHAWKRFLMYMGGMAIFGMIAEMLVVNLGLRNYAPEVQNALSGFNIQNTPIDTLYYVPVFSALVLGFYKYWTLIIENRAVLIMRGGWLRRLGLSFIAVLLFEFMIEPMVINANFPAWSYFYHDMTIILTVGWVALIWLSIYIVETLWTNFGLREKFFLYIATITIFALPFESYIIKAGYRVYEGTSAGNAFSGIPVPFLNIPHEVAVAIPMYFALILGFIAAWDIMLVDPLKKEPAHK